MRSREKFCRGLAAGLSLFYIVLFSIFLSSRVPFFPNFASFLYALFGFYISISPLDYSGN